MMKKKTSLSTNPSAPQGMILLSALVLLLLNSLLLNQLLLAVQLQLQISLNTGSELQQFQAAEAGIKQGENQLIQQKNNLNTKLPIILHVNDDENYPVEVEILPLPKRFCLKPEQTQGRYYQVTATAYKKRALKHISQLQSLIRLQTLIAIPEKTACSAELPHSTSGRSAWVQLT
jgi:hypothetical protein